MKQLLKEWRQFINENQTPDIKKLERSYIEGLKNKRNAQAGGALQKLTKLAKMGKYDINNLKKLKSSIKEFNEEEYYHIVDASYDDGTLAEEIEFWDDVVVEAEYRGRKVKLNKPTRGDVKKFKVFVKDPKTGNVKKVNFGDKKMRIKKSNPKRRKSFRARHNCDNPGPKTKARYWSCRKW